MNALEDKPYIVSWNLTKQCNLSCPHCYIDAQPYTGFSDETLMSNGSQRTIKIPLNPPLEKGGKGGFEKLFSSESSELTTDDARSIIKALSSLNSNLMLILTGGEPMLREDIFDIVHSA